MITILETAAVAVLVGAKRSAGAAAGALFLTRILPDDQGPNFWDLVVRILTAFADIIKAWPGGVPLNAKDVLLAIFRAVAINEIAPKIDTFMKKLLIAPSLSGTIWAIFIVLAVAPGVAIMLERSVEYFRETGKLEGAEEELWWMGEHPEFVPLLSWGGRFAVVFLVETSFATLIGSIIALVWDGLFSLATMFYQPLGTSFGASVVDVILNVISGTNPIEFLISFVVGFGIFLWMGAVYFVRFFSFFWENVDLPIKLPQIMSGRREVDYRTQTSDYFESWGLLALTTVVVLLTPLLVGDIVRLTGLWAVAAFFLVAWVVHFKLPKLWRSPRLRGFARRLPGRVFGTASYTEEVEAPEDETTEATVPPPAQTAQVQATSRRARQVSELIKTVDPEGYKSLKTLVAGGVAGAAVASGVSQRRQSRPPQEVVEELDPDRELLRVMPQELRRQMYGLDDDPEMNDALFARLGVHFRSNVPKRPLDEVVEDMKEILSDVREKDPERFKEYVEAGRRLIDKTRTEKKTEKQDEEL